MKKILHLFQTEKFTGGFIKLINNNSKYCHTFWVYGESYLNKIDNYIQQTNVKYYPRISIELNKSNAEKRLLKFDLIIYHGVFDNVIVDFFFEHKVLLCRLALYFWGGEKEVFNNWKDKIKRKYVIKNAVAIITIIPQDYIGIKKDYHPKGKYFCARYFDDEASEILKDSHNLVKRNDRDTINIQIGNSATETNRHIEVLDSLAKFKTNNIKIFLPLSYGNMEYAEYVANYGKKIFGDKIVVLKKIMPLEDYYLFISKIDIAIFNMKRQQAMGNIYALMQSGSKIFLHKGGKLWDFFTKDSDCIIAGADEIVKMTFEQFISFPEIERQKNREQIRKIFSLETSVRQWENIFEAL